ncbi:DUF5134 domain-containing protein [Streptomyces sp. NPDC091272]|uniref:DUF5134 domain-containing protein n=1 Tax=Streptomyces sp. NPDC091272 TaxID=3365981 RepID=UPI0037F79FC2
MHGAAMSGWLLVALCGVTSAYCLLRMRSGPRAERPVARGEALMGLGMAVMAVPAAVFAPPGWSWAVYATVFGAAALRALWWVRGGTHGSHHLHHLIGSAAMVYMAVVMAPGAGGAAGGHVGHGAVTAGGVPLLTGVLLAYYAVYVLRAGARLIPLAGALPSASPAPVPVPAGGAFGWGARPELALACRLSMALGMFTMLLTL